MINIIILITAVLGFIGIGIQFYYSLTGKLEQGFSVFYGIVHYFSFFTVIVNTLLAILLLTYVLFPNSKLSHWFQKTKNTAALALYIFIVGFIYYTLLNNRELQILEMFATHILHGYVPVVFIFFWFYKFRNGDLKFSDSINWILFPLLYFIYILLRGAIIDAYPYFFLNVTKIGYAKVLFYALGILIIFILSGFCFVAIDQKIKKNSRSGSDFNIFLGINFAVGRVVFKRGTK